MRALACLALCCLPLAHAADDTVQAGVSGDRFVAAGSVRQSRPVEGDLFGVGGEVHLLASVGGDAVLGGGDVRVGERVAQDLYAGGGHVRVEAAVGRNARLAGGNVEITPDARIEGNLSIAGGSVEVRAPVGGDVQVAGGDVLVDSAVGGDLRVASGALTLGPNARIAGKVRYHGRLDRDPAATVGTGVERLEPRRVEAPRQRARTPGWGRVAWTLGLVALAALLVAVFPAGSRRLGESLRGDPAMALLLGFIALVCVPVAALLLAITIVGIPLALVLLLLYVLALLVGYAATAVVIGDAALARLRAQDASRTAWRVGAATAATVALAAATSVPILGGLVVLAILLAGLGAIALATQDHRAGAGVKAA